MQLCKVCQWLGAMPPDPSSWIYNQWKALSKNPGYAPEIKVLQHLKIVPTIQDLYSMIIWYSVLCS